MATLAEADPLHGRNELLEDVEVGPDAGVAKASEAEQSLEELSVASTRQILRLTTWMLLVPPWMKRRPALRRVSVRLPNVMPGSANIGHFARLLALGPPTCANHRVSMSWFYCAENCKNSFRDGFGGLCAGRPLGQQGACSDACLVIIININIIFVLVSPTMPFRYFFSAAQEMCSTVSGTVR